MGYVVKHNMLKLNADEMYRSLCNEGKVLDLVIIIQKFRKELSGIRRLRRCILFTDEDQFSHYDVNNTHKSHALSDNDPHSTVDRISQLLHPVKVWCAVLDGGCVPLSP